MSHLANNWSMHVHDMMLEGGHLCQRVNEKKQVANYRVPTTHTEKCQEESTPDTGSATL